MTPMISHYKHVGACKEKEGRETGRTGTGAVKREGRAACAKMAAYPDPFFSSARSHAGVPIYYHTGIRSTRKLT